jgi:hypothetical protein
MFSSNSELNSKINQVLPETITTNTINKIETLITDDKNKLRTMVT